MTIIKLNKPMTILAGKPLPKELVESGAIKLPFEATGMKCTNQELADTYGFNKTLKKVEVKEVKTFPKLTKETKKKVKQNDRI